MFQKQKQQKKKVVENKTVNLWQQLIKKIF